MRALKAEHAQVVESQIAELTAAQQARRDAQAQHQAVLAEQQRELEAELAAQLTEQDRPLAAEAAEHGRVLEQ